MDNQNIITLRSIVGSVESHCNSSVLVQTKIVKIVVKII